jgi:hypothetical protein
MVGDDCTHHKHLDAHHGTHSHQQPHHHACTLTNTAAALGQHKRQHLSIHKNGED